MRQGDPNALESFRPETSQSSGFPMATAEATSYADEVQDAAEQGRKPSAFVPNLIMEMTKENPAVADAYLTSQGLLAVSSYNDCHYCTKAHAAAGQQAGLDTETTATINEGGLPNDDRLRPLVQATRRILGKRGWLSGVDESEFEDLGLGRPEFYEIITLVGIKTMSAMIS